MSRPLLIENGTILSTGRTPRVLRNHSVLIENGFISRVSPKGKLSRFSGKRIDASGKVVMPGLINAHNHFYSTFARGLTKAKPSKDFMGVLRNLWWRLDRALTAEDCYYSALIALLDSIRHGTTTIIDHHASPNAVVGSLGQIARAVKETGLRTCLCYEVSDRDGSKIARQGIAENAWFIDQCQRENDPHIQAMFGLHASFTISDDTMEKAAAFGHALKTGFHIHVAEAQGDQDIALRKSGKRVVEQLKQFEILGPRSIAAHCIHITAKEMDLLAETQTAVVHNPQSNLNNAVGIAKIIEMKKRGVLLGLGTDAMTTNMLEELRVALWAQHLGNNNPSVGFGEVTHALFSANREIAARSFGGARLRAGVGASAAATSNFENAAAGLQPSRAPERTLRFGEIREGAVGDIAIFDYDPPTPLDDTNLLGHLVFGISQASVDTTIVGGRVLMENRKLTLNLDIERINARARELARALWKRF
jgi:putative selenium metabolism protein SsnA